MLLDGIAITLFDRIAVLSIARLTIMLLDCITIALLNHMKNRPAKFVRKKQFKKNPVVKLFQALKLDLSKGRGADDNILSIEMP